ESLRRESFLGGSTPGSKRTSQVGVGDRMRPLSFTGIVSSQESTRVTEAASLESRVKDLERQVATLKNFISDYLDTRPKTSATAARRSEPVHSLLPAFEEKKDRPRRYSFTSIDHTVTDKLPPPRVDPD